MLWTDTDWLNTGDLTTLDSEVADVATAESITLEDLTTGNGCIHRAIEEAGDAIMTHLQVFGGYLNTGTVSSNHYAAVMNVGLPSVHRSKILLTQVVVSGVLKNSWTPLKRWAAYWALYAFYKEASNRTGNDRYQEKRDNYQKVLHTTYWEALRATGLPIVRTPLPCPGAVYEPQAGLWASSNVLAVSGSGLAGTYDVAITYWNGTLVNNQESGASAIQTVTVGAGQTIQVTLAGLTPPTGQQPPATLPLSVVDYGKATHWNIYVGPTGGRLMLQNASPIPIATTSQTLTGAPLTTGTLLGTGQYPELYMAFANLVNRG